MCWGEIEIQKHGDAVVQQQQQRQYSGGGYGAEGVNKEKEKTLLVRVI